jgi:hypothetical protein
MAFEATEASFVFKYHQRDYEELFFSQPQLPTILAASAANGGCGLRRRNFFSHQKFAPQDLDH